MLKITSIAALLIATIFAPQASAQSEKLLNNYNNSNNFITIINSTLTHPTEEGLFYAQRILSECRAVKTDTGHWKKNLEKSGPSKNPEQARAINQLTERCNLIPEEQLSDIYINQLIIQAKNRGSLWLPNAAKRSSQNIGEIERAFGRKSQHTTNIIEARRSDDFIRVGNTLDPLLIDDYGIRLLISKDEKTKRTVYKINGKNYPLNYKTDIGLAMYLVPCEFGLKCDASDFSVALLCASSGTCDASRFEAVRRMTMAVGSSYQDTLKISKEIAQSLRQQKARNDSVR